MTPPQFPQKQSGDRPIKTSPPTLIWLIVTIIGIIFLYLVLARPITQQQPVSLNYSQFLKDAASKQVLTATINNATGQITGKLEEKQTYKTKVRYQNTFKTETKQKITVKTYVASGPTPVIPSDISQLRSEGVAVNFITPGPSIWAEILPYLLWIGLPLLLLFFFLRRSSITSVMSIGKSGAKLYTSERPKTTFADVAGYNTVKQEISEVVDFLKNPYKYRAIGARIPRGILLVGPPGTGKTLLARAVAGEAGVPFLSVSGSDFMEMFVGVGASRVRDLFQTARKQAPCIIFIDEIDSIGRKRGTGLGGGHDEREQTLNQLLSEMDGFDPAENVIMMAATNRPDILDLALLRPGRFDRQIVVPLPDVEERLPILAVHARDKRLGPDVDLELVARGSPGMSGADLANLVNEAALHAVRRNSPVIEMVDFEAARDRVLMGQHRDSMVLSEEEKERVAYHEGGHAVLAYVLEHADPLHKVTIIPTGMALGATQQLPMEERHIHTREVIEDKIAVAMGGRAAELIIYGDLSTGAANDLQSSTELARKMIREWGFSERLGPMAWGSSGMVFLGEDLVHTRDFSEATNHIIDEEVSHILRKQEARAIETLTLHKKGLELVAKALLEKETITGKEVAELVDSAYGKPVHEGKTSVPHFTPIEKTAVNLLKDSN